MNNSNHRPSLTQRIARGAKIGALALGSVAAVPPAGAFLLVTGETMNPLIGTVAAVEVAAIGIGIATGAGTSYKVCPPGNAQCVHENKTRRDARKVLLGPIKETAPNLYFTMVDKGYPAPYVPPQKEPTARSAWQPDLLPVNNAYRAGTSLDSALTDTLYR